MIALIVAVADNGVIGQNNQLPWHLPADLAFFKKVTKGHTVIMGRKTAESIGKPLPGRRNIVISSQINLNLPSGFEYAPNLEEALKQVTPQEVSFLIGGSRIFDEALSRNLPDRLYITRVRNTPKGDVFLPDFDLSQWEKVMQVERPSDERNPANLCFEAWDKPNGLPLPPPVYPDL